MTTLFAYRPASRRSHCPRRCPFRPPAQRGLTIMSRTLPRTPEETMLDRAAPGNQPPLTTRQYPAMHRNSREGLVSLRPNSPPPCLPESGNNTDRTIVSLAVTFNT
ncbi:hypothetical protein MRX96_008724 [Rhipicephalus microplus]